MKLAPSSKLWETLQGSASTLPQQIQTVAELGYQGIEMRYPLIPEAGESNAIKVALHQHNIELTLAPRANVPSTLALISYTCLPYFTTISVRRAFDTILLRCHNWAAHRYVGIRRKRVSSRVY